VPHLFDEGLNPKGKGGRKSTFSYRRPGLLVEGGPTFKEVKLTKNQYWNQAWNPIRLKGGGYHCTKISPGCLNCWAEGFNVRTGHGRWKEPPFQPEFELSLRTLEAPLHWKKPRVIATQWLGDLFHEAIPFTFQRDIWQIANNLDRHDFLFLTKRPEIMKAVINDGPPGLWYGLTVCNQAEADEKIPQLLQVPGKLWISVEPMLEQIDLSLEYGKVDFVAVGCETGPHRRPCKLEWIESIVQQCQAAGVPCFVKALSINGKVIANMAQFPLSLRMREVPWK
jgi:protein gp37